MMHYLTIDVYLIKMVRYIQRTALHYTQIRGVKETITTLNNDSLMCSLRDPCFHQYCLKQ